MNRTDQQPGAGQKSEGGKSSPENQGDNMSQPKQPDAGGQPDQKDGPQSPSGSSKQSNSQGQTAGDQSGGGQQGGGQQANQPGMGTAGSQADAQNGGNRSESRGPGTAGSKAGEEVQTDRQTGKSAVRRDGDGSPAGKPQPSDRVGKQPSPKDDAGDRPGGQATDREGGRPGQRESERPSGSHSQGNPTNGGRPGEEDRGPPPVPRGEPGGDQANLEFARKQTNLALEHLKDQLDKDRRDLLQRLGWSPDDARRFLAKWEKMQQATADKGPQGKAAQKQLDDALRALGLRWRGTELRGGGTSRDKLGGLRENARFKPPAEWAEQVGDYHRTVAGEK
jgi:hypothetical protein